MGECGIRGGYAEIINMDPEVMKVLLKSISAMLCPTVLGQVVMDVVVNPPRSNEPSHGQFQKEKKETLRSLAERSQLVVDTLNSIPGYKVTVLPRDSQRKLDHFYHILFSFFSGKSTDGRDVCVPALRATVEGDRGGTSEGPGAGRLLRVQIVRDHRDLRDPGLRFRPDTRHVPLSDHDTAAKGENQNNARSTKAIPYQIP